MEKQLHVIASDFVAFYRELSRHSLLTPERLNMDAFQAIFDRMHMEYLHYAGSSSTQPFHVEVVENVLQLAAAYLSLPTDVSPSSRAFGLYLVFFLYASQPSIDTSPVKVRVARGTLQSYLDDIADSVEDADPQPAFAAQLSRRVTDGEKRILLALHKAGAWHIMPFVDISVHLQTLLKVHDAEGVPLGRGGAKVQRQQHQMTNAVVSDTALSRELEAYEAMKRRLGLNDALGGN
ncbi:small nuclear RNA activating protein 3 [Trypanosoma rangeli]|uniref:Small nuclear RNA activating protein 3 n=1 Tax=Trypanosoma rangeli TaxID=5698 RepID=A0A3R7NAB8_TRYRA|nr:small nuclear RNA activating protein 3 [Trypanosoma rangeli]RNF03144.1 small nuclear RNA activating protein 3 [Trypanosoma rangeli]|eukprot:RNF03144.1 small nuclear RNA activating protein 3 [Trypanosoma rangeli]